MTKRTRTKNKSRSLAAEAIRPEVVVGGYAQFLLRALAIAAAGLWIYWPVLHGDWLWDDDFYITDNELLRQPDRLWKAWFVPGSFIEYYPIEQTLQWIQWKLWGRDTLGYHVTNLVLHIANALLVWRFLAKFGLRLAWLGGLIFVVHPVNVESVAWISEFKNGLSLPPFLLAMCAWIDYEERRRRFDYLLAFALFVVAMLCKISMAPFPAVILLYAWWKRGRIGWNDLKESAPFLIVSLLLGAATIQSGIWYFQDHLTYNEPVPMSGFVEKLALAGLSLTFYFAKCFLPVGLMPIYPQWSVDPPPLVAWLAWASFTGLISALWMRRRNWGRHALLGLGFFILNLLPFLGFMSVSYMSFTWVMDHFLYLPAIGLICLVVAAMGQIATQLAPPARVLAMGVVAVLLALMAWGSHGYARLHINQEALWAYTVHCNPGAYTAHNNLGIELVNAGRYPEALLEFEASLRLKPDYVQALYNLGGYYGRVGQTSESIDQYEQALRIDPDYAMAHNNLGTAFATAGRLPEAIEQFQKALKINSDLVEAHSNLGYILVCTGDIPGAIDQCEQALRIDPTNLAAHDNLGLAFFRAGRVEEAIAQYEQTLAIDPDDANARNHLPKLQALEKSESGAR